MPNGHVNIGLSVSSHISHLAKLYVFVRVHTCPWPSMHIKWKTLAEETSSLRTSACVRARLAVFELRPIRASGFTFPCTVPLRSLADYSWTPHREYYIHNFSYSFNGHRQKERKRVKGSQWIIIENFSLGVQMGIRYLTFMLFIVPNWNSHINR